jgi:hypothetical protein
MSLLSQSKEKEQKYLLERDELKERLALKSCASPNKAFFRDELLELTKHSFN